jgi:sulfur relay (sulfurtransferase) DsrF/TusC family protein
VNEIRFLFLFSHPIIVISRVRFLDFQTLHYLSRGMMTGRNNMLAMMRYRLFQTYLLLSLRHPEEYILSVYPASRVSSFFVIIMHHSDMRISLRKIIYFHRRRFSQSVFLCDISSGVKKIKHDSIPETHKIDRIMRLCHLFGLHEIFVHSNRLSEWGLSRVSMLDRIRRIYHIFSRGRF